MEYNRRSHSIYKLTYHIVFVTKYRKPCINDELNDFIKTHTAYLCTKFDGELISAETDLDQVHLLVSLPPDARPSEFVRVVKTQLSKEIHANEAYDRHVKQYLFGNAPLWSPSYFIATTGSVVTEKIKAYVESQHTDEHKRKYEKSGRYKKQKKK